MRRRTAATRRKPSVAQGTPNADAEGQMAANDPSRSMMRLPETPKAAPGLRLGETGSKGALGNALRNLQRYVQQQSFDNPTGSGDSQGLIQFDSKGVDFGPWLRRFVAQVKRNWFVPQAAMIMKGHVVITFNIHRNGAITDIEVKQPSSVESFNHRGGQRADELESDAAAAAGISVGLGVLYRDVPLQRGPRRLQVMPCRCRRARNSSAC